MSDWGFETRAIHAGQEPDPSTGAVNVPVYLSSTFAQEAVGRHRGYEYSRTGNPTRAALEVALASLEGAGSGFAFASGMAAEDALLRVVASPGEHVVIPTDVYGGTWRLVAKVHAETGVEFSAVDMSDLAGLDNVWRPDTSVVWIETPTNPALSIVDIAAVSDVAHRRGAKVVVDNTFATPWLQRPLELGADAVVHSTTKYLGGHSDVVGGFVGVSDQATAERLAFVENATGAIPGPLDCYLVLRGLRTLSVRMERHCHNAAAVAEVLRSHAAVDTVMYPGLPSHPGHAVAARQMRGFGGMVSFVLRGGEEAALALVERTKVFTLAESLGGVESLIEHPARMTHASVAGSSNEVDPGLVRLSVGLETTEDLLADLTGALDSL